MLPRNIKMRKITLYQCEVQVYNLKKACDILQILVSDLCLAFLGTLQYSIKDVERIQYCLIIFP